MRKRFYNLCQKIAATQVYQENNQIEESITVYKFEAIFNPKISNTKKVSQTTVIRSLIQWRSLALNATITFLWCRV